MLIGPNAKTVKVGDFVCFPNNMGVPIANIQIENYGNLKKGIFLNEQRIFGICSVLDDKNTVAAHTVKKRKMINESSATYFKNHCSK